MYPGEYTLIGNELSLFSRKLEAQLRFQQIPWQWEFKTLERSGELEARAGTHFVPLFRTPDKWLIHDTISIGPMLDARFSEHRVIPDSPLQRACCYILEDAFNHWLGKFAVHTRWCYPDNVAWVGPRFGANMQLDRSIDEPFTEQELEELTPIGTMMYEGFGKNACDVNGVGEDQREAMRGSFNRMLEALSVHFRDNDFLLGPRPCLADFALAGASKAHFVTDPTPKSWLGDHEKILTDYTERFFGAGLSCSQDWLAEDAVPETLGPVLDYLQDSYYQFAAPNIAAGLAGEKYFEYDYGFGATQARTQRRLNLARLHVQDELRRCGAADSAEIKALFNGRGILAYYLETPGS